ncbi:MAG: ABC transporter ATP-binding protein [Promethearchaeota archaeon]
MNETKGSVLIQLKNLTKRFGSFPALNNINIPIYRGEVLGILGPNGAGKTTTMKLIANLLKPTEGGIWIHNGIELEQLSPLNRDFLLENIGFLIENPAFYRDSTPRKLLTYFAKLKGYPRDKIPQRVEEMVKLVGLYNWIDEKMGKFSKGMRQKIGIISAIVHDPDIVIFDEPYTGLDPKARMEVRDLILHLKSLNKTVFLSSHLLYEVSEVADRIAILSHGFLIACDTLENLEQMIKESVIHLELNQEFKDPEHSTQMCIKIQNVLQKLITSPVNFNQDSNVFELDFDGSPKKQQKILKTLISNEFPVLEFSVPKAGLLEKLYLNFISQSNKTYIQAQKQTIQLEKAF